MIRAAVLVLALAATARAYDSRCYLPGGAECAPGPQAARNRWIGVSDEHRQLWLRTLDVAGLTPLVAGEAEDQFDLDVFTDNVPVDVAGASMPTYDPLPFVDAQLVQRRTTSPGEFAQLPDFGFALWDWATGLETCPLDAASPGSVAPGPCHDFSTHMGAANSNHFLPQAQAFFAYYHQLALGRAAVCKTMKGKLGSDASRFGDFLDACAKEAFVLEAIGHHFLQDAWSSGHMWERWGSPDLLDFTDLPHALLVAMTAGLIHGARGVLQDKAGFVGFDVNDALCAPGPTVAFALPPATPVPALGDLFLGSLLANDGVAFPDQYRALFSCTAASVRQVAAAMGESPGALDPSLVAIADPTADVCFAQRATNAAMSAGIGLDFKDTAGVQHRIELDSLQVASLLPLASAFIGTDPSNLSPDVVAAYLFDLVGMVAQARIVAAIDPTGTSLATGGLGTLVGVDRNAAFVQEPLAPYVDPPLPWPDPPTQANDAPERALALARVFHRAHAIDWCNRFQDGRPDGLDVNALRDHVTNVQQTDGRPSHVDAACAVCTEFAARHLRVGTDANDYDTAREPLCRFLADDPMRAQYVFQPGKASDAIPALATAYCGCGSTSTTTTTTSSTTTTTLLTPTGTATWDLNLQPPSVSRFGRFRNLCRLDCADEPWAIRGLGKLDRWHALPLVSAAGKQLSGDRHARWRAIGERHLQLESREHDWPPQLPPGLPRRWRVPLCVWTILDGVRRSAPPAGPHPVLRRVPRDDLLPGHG